MNNIFEEVYNTIAEAKKAYKVATTEDERDFARKVVEEAENQINEMGRIACKIMNCICYDLIDLLNTVCRLTA